MMLLAAENLKEKRLSSSFAFFLFTKLYGQMQMPKKIVSNNLKHAYFFILVKFSGQNYLFLLVC